MPFPLEDPAVASAVRLALGQGTGRVVYTSTTCVSDSELEIANAETGVDQTAELQAILDEAANGPLLVIWDGKYTSGKLRIRSNTHIFALPGCGAILKDAGETILMENYVKTFAVGANPVTSDANITIENLTLNGNRLNQATRANATDGWLVTLRFVGVKGLHCKGLRVLTTNCFSTQTANCENMVFEDCFVDTDRNNMVQNQDGLHFHGPIKNCIVRGTSGFAADDIVSFVANDIGARGPDHAQNMLGSLGQPYGDIVNVLIDGLILDGSNYGIRLLSSTNLMDRIVIKNVVGTTRYHHWLIVGANIPEYGNPTGRGNFGTIDISDCPVLVEDPLSDEYIQLDGRIDTLRFHGIKRDGGPTFAAVHPTWRIEEGAVIRNLIIDGYNYTHKDNKYYANVAPPHIENNGHIGRLELINPSLVRAFSGPANGVLIENNGTINVFNRTGLFAPNFDTIVAGNAPTTSTVGVADNLPTLTTPWTGGNYYEEGDAGGYMDDIFDPSSLYLYYPFSQTEHAWQTDNDAFGGNVKITARLQFVSLPAGGTLGVFCRGSGTTPTVCSAGYSVLLYAPNTTTVAFRLAYNGFSGDFIGGDHVITTSALIPYDVELNVNGSAISAYVQRSTDNFYLTSSNTWSATRQVFASGTNTTHAAAAGQVGVINWQSNSVIAAKRSVKDFTIAAAS